MGHHQVDTWPVYWRSYCSWCRPISCVNPFRATFVHEFDVKSRRLVILLLKHYFVYNLLCWCTGVLAINAQAQVTHCRLTPTSFCIYVYITLFAYFPDVLVLTVLAWQCVFPDSFQNACQWRQFGRLSLDVALVDCCFEILLILVVGHLQDSFDMQ
jgi:hypothetical protein